MAGQSGVTFSGKYPTIRKDIYKGTLGQKFDPKKDNYVLGGKKPYATERGYYNAQKKVFDTLMSSIDKIEATSVPVNADLFIRTGRKGTYGYQWQAELEYTNANGQRKVIQGERTTGMGYDKVSTAGASALNQSPEFIKILMDAREKKKKLSNAVTLNAGKPWLPHYNGGVGMSSLNAILRDYGYNVYENGRDDMVRYTYILKRRRA